METLALFGGRPVRTKPFPAHNHIGPEEKAAVMNVMDSGVLSRFLGCWHNDFYGGEQVRAFEKAWSEFTGARYTVSVNSAASGLVAAIGAAGIGPGDEVIVPPYTMSATTTAVVAYGGIPVFGDVEKDIFTLDPAKIEALITPRTKAILAVHLFGHAADMDPIIEIARRHKLVVIEDAAQAPGTLYKGRRVGILGDMTVFSLNYHKHIHTGEGGLVTTEDARLAERLQLIRNHGESVVEGKGVTEIDNCFGFNFRLTEIEAAIGLEQLKKLPRLLAERTANAEYLNKHIARLPGIRATTVRPGCTHVYYAQPFLFDESIVGISRERFVEAVNAELPLPLDRDEPILAAGYVRPLYMLPMFQKKIAMGKNGFPFNQGPTRYEAGTCPVVERIQASELILNEFMRPPATPDDMKDVVQAFEKVYQAKDRLKKTVSR